MISIKERLAELNKHHKEMSERKPQVHDITHEFVLRSKLRDLHYACKVINLFIFLVNSKFHFIDYLLFVTGVGPTR